MINGTCMLLNAPPYSHEPAMAFRPTRGHFLASSCRENGTCASSVLAMAICYRNAHPEEVSVGHQKGDEASHVALQVELTSTK